MSDATRAELQALLVRAATLEAQRQAASKAGDAQAQQGIEAELRALWRRHADLERRERVA